MKARIVKRTDPAGACCQDDFFTLEEAQRHLCYFDGTPTREEVVR